MKRKILTKINAVVFDFDGVCLDTETARYRSWQDIYTSYGCELPLDEWCKNIGRASYESDPFPFLEKCVGTSLNREEVHAVHRATELEIADSMVLMPGFVERLEEAQVLGIPCGIASSSSHRWVDRHLLHRGIHHYFKVVLCREDTKNHKPDPEPYLTACEQLGVEPCNAVAVEDSPPGIAAAKAAGMYCVAVPCPMTVAMDFSAAHQRIASLDEIGWKRLVEVVT